MLQEGRGRRPDLREYIRQDHSDIESFAEREAGRSVEEGNQEAAAVARPDQDMGRHERDQGQEAAARSQEAD